MICIYWFVIYSLALFNQDKFVVDEDEQSIDGLEIAMSLQYGLDKIEENSSVKMVFMNLGPMTIAEKNRKTGEQTRQSTVTTLMSHFRLLRNTIDSYEEVSVFLVLLPVS